MLNFIKGFRAKEEGAVTVDWVVLTAVIVGLGIVVVTIVGNGTVVLAERISTELAGEPID